MMAPFADETILWIPSTEEEKEMVREQMNRLLDTSHFKNSRRYPPLLRFIVEETLEGRGEFLKERLIGIRVFDRPADYDTASDPIVRVTIAEVRKRIAQYYHEEAHDSEMRIELLPGRYEPEFRPSRDHHRDSQADHPASLSSHHLSSSHLPEEGFHSTNISEGTPGSTATAYPRSRIVGIALGFFAAAALLLLSAGGWRWLHPSALDQFWSPIIAAKGAITYCLPNGAGKSHDLINITPPPPEAIKAGAVPTFLDHEALGENVVFSDALAAVRISNLMATYHRETRFRLNVGTTLDDLRHGPVVLIGGMDNQWTLRAIAPLRFRFAGSDEEFYWIMDTKYPANKSWALDLKKQYTNVNRDYAIIARIHDEATGELEVIVAGIGMSGTAAAGEFLVDPHQLEELRRRVGPGFTDRDFEAVLSTDVVNGMAGSPHILAVTTW
jgi:hypothetical protein